MAGYQRGLARASRRAFLESSFAIFLMTSMSGVMRTGIVMTFARRGLMAFPSATSRVRVWRCIPEGMRRSRTTDGTKDGLSSVCGG